MQIILDPQGYQLLISRRRISSKQKKKFILLLHRDTSVICLASLLLLLLLRQFFSHPPLRTRLFLLSHSAIFRIRRGCRRLNERSTLPATLFADRFAGLVVVFTYPRERGRRGCVRAARRGSKGDREGRIVNRLTVSTRRHACRMGATSLGRQFPWIVFPHKCVHSFSSSLSLSLLSTGARCLARLIGGTRCCLSSRPLSNWSTPSVTPWRGDKREKGRRVKGVNLAGTVSFGFSSRFFTRVPAARLSGILIGEERCAFVWRARDARKLGISGKCLAFFFLEF